jgi:tRNA(Ile)-lysidine synthase
VAKPSRNFGFGRPRILRQALKNLPAPSDPPRRAARFRYHLCVLKPLEQYLRRHRLLRAGERVGVAVSGGADSVALLRALAALAPELGIIPFVLHLNHQLRAAESDTDQEFVASLAAQLSLDAIIESCDVASLAALHGLSLEASGRRARYDFFQRAAAEHRLDSVATAHTRDDQAETVLLRLLRGTGTSGLAGIHRVCNLSALCDCERPSVADRSSASGCVPASVRDRSGILCRVPDAEAAPAPRLIRPLLGTSRQQVEEYLNSLGQPFRHDASNLDPRFLRNRVRAELLPALERDYNPQLRQALCETAEVAAAENAFLEDLVSAALGQRAEPQPAKTQPAEPTTSAEQAIELPLFQAQPVALQRRILRRLCQPHGLALDFAQLEGLRDFALAGRAGCIGLPRGFTAEVVRHKLLPLRLRLLSPRGR